MVVTNLTLPWLQSHLGQHLVTSDRIYLYQEMTYLEPGQSVLLLNAAVGAALAAAPGAAVVVAAAAVDAAPWSEMAAELLYPDGVIRWTWVVIGDKKHQDSLKEIG